MDTSRLVSELASAARPVRPIRAPASRAMIWLGVTVPFLIAVVLLHGPDPAAMTFDTRLVVEQTAAALTAVLAAMAAFVSVVPGARRFWLWLPLAPLAVWLVALGQGCAADYAAIGSEAFALRIDAACFWPMVIAGTIPAAVMVVMLRRGVPLQPRLTLALAALAVGGAANVALQLFHHADISLMVLIWHLGAVALLSALFALIAPRILHWRSAAA